jgi:hypothetical protein
MYRWGLAFAVLAGVTNNLGLVLNKLEVNRDLPSAGGPGFYARLLRRPLWVAGIVLQIGLGTVFFLLAQLYVGPALIPGLMATGLVALALGSAWIVREAPRAGEVVGMTCLVVSALAFGRSRLRIDLGAYDVLSPDFLLRAGLFSLAACALFAALMLTPRLWPRLLQSRGERRRGKPSRGPLLALSSGLLYVLSNFWVGPFVAAVLRVLCALGVLDQPRGPVLPALGMFAFSSAVLVLTNLFGIALMQRAFQLSTAASAVPLQLIPTQVAPPAVYLLVFRLPSPGPGSLLLFSLGLFLVIASSFLLTGRPAMQRDELQAA